MIYELSNLILFRYCFDYYTLSLFLNVEKPTERMEILREQINAGEVSNKDAEGLKKKAKEA